MNDVLMTYYHILENITPSNLVEIIELCNLNSHLFKDAIVQEQEFREKGLVLLKAQSDVINSQDFIGRFLCGIGLYFDKQRDLYNSRRLFELALPSSNIIAMVHLSNIQLDETNIDKYLEMEKNCEDIIHVLIYNCNSVITIQQLFFDQIFIHKRILDSAIKFEKEIYDNFQECKNRTSKTIKEAIDLATYNIDFDIESLYNSEEINRLL